ncbi:fibronectin [Astrocystis sublimbata]|nr:fibronectin [Astrocystis sublimbata]
MGWLQYLTTALALAIAAPCASALLAFPGAEGFGRNAVGGRGGSVYHVTNLNDKGTGSFRDAVSQANRIVVFDVGGTINITDRVVVSKNIYLAGQTAPGGGITVYGNGLSWSNAHESIVRYMRFRMGKSGAKGKDGITIADGRNMIFDHVSVTWGRDETFSISGDVSNVTIQDSIIGQGLDTHSCGGLIQTDGGVSLFRNLYVDNKTRNPKVKGVNDFQNNVIYNWGGGGGYIAGDSSGQSYANIINNYFISGPITGAAPFTRGNGNFHGYISNNFHDANKNGILDGTPLCAQASCYGNMAVTRTPFAYPGPSTLLSPRDAVSHVLSQVGASFPSRDSVDAHLVSEVRSYGRSGQLISDEKAAPMYGPGFVAGGAKPRDSDGDGIPDAWEEANGLDPRDAGDAMRVGADGYVNLERYVNSLVAA